MTTQQQLISDAGRRANAQRRVLTVLVVSQVLGGAGLAAGITVGALLAQDMLHSTSLAGLPSALFTAGSAVTAVAVGRLSQRRGRRWGLSAGYATGAVGAIGIIVAADTDNPVLLFVSLAVYGAGTATNLQARYAGADLAAPAHRARDLSTVLVATTLGGVVGPNLAAPTASLAKALDLPALAGPFLLAVLAYTLAAVVLTVWLRPDPLLLARELDAEERASTTEAPAAPAATAGVLPGALIMVLTQLVMVAIMTMTPIHMSDHGHTTAATGLVIALHVAAMYLPSPFTGRLTDKFGTNIVTIAAAAALLAAGLVAALAPGDSLTLLITALMLLGLGWNLGLIAGTTLITESVPLATRAKTQGAVDVTIAVAGATGGMGSGLVVAASSYPTLAAVGGSIALVMLPVVVLAGRKR